MCVYFSLIIALLPKLVSQSWGLNGSQSWHTSGGSKDICHLVFFKLILPYDQLSKFILPDPDMKFMGCIDQVIHPMPGIASHTAPEATELIKPKAQHTELYPGRILCSSYCKQNSDPLIFSALPQLCGPVQSSKQSCWLSDTETYGERGRRVVNHFKDKHENPNSIF